MKFIAKLLALFIYLLSFLIKRNKKVWAFGSGTGYDGNTKYLLQYVIDNHPEITPIWITKRKKETKELRLKGIKAYYTYSLTGIFYSIKSGFYIVSGSLADINFYTSGGAKYVQLWHGVGIKCCLWNNKYSSMNTEGLFMGFVKRPSFYIEPDFILGASNTMNEVFSKMFRAKKSKCHSYVYPRNTLLNLSVENIMKYIVRWENEEMKLLVERITSNKKVLLYMPTYRDNNPHFLSEQNWELEKLNNYLSKNDYLLLIKLHPHMINEIDFGGYDHIIEIDKRMDIYPIMPFTHTLITDYSSVYYDYILMNNKQIILYIPDEDEYIKNSRDLLMPYNENCKGVKVRNFQELLESLSYTNSIDYKKLRNKFWGYSLKTNMEDLLCSLKQL